ncbi:hypothetical protein NE237_025875 [Protea cynaroides]|uniref:Uncharacterized protein n=1 Tax=Protea cynaroides TaxID=273540 RepID=A0A9Q0H7V0_9MAGN|nr:hypothetical protein NE237_025875 [Protea cynaroides]
MTADFGVGDARSVLSGDILTRILPMESSDDVAVLQKRSEISKETMQSTMGSLKVIRMPCFQVELSERCMQTIDGGLAIGDREIGLVNSFSLFVEAMEVMAESSRPAAGVRSESCGVSMRAAMTSLVMADGSLMLVARFGSGSRGSGQDIAAIGEVSYMVTTMGYQGNNLGTPCIETMAPTGSQRFFETDYGSRDCCNRGARWWLTISACPACDVIKEGGCFWAGDSSSATGDL